MGAYLRKPVTDKVSSHGDCVVGGRRLVYAYTAMQGWRVTMEDAHSIIPDLGDETSLFAVYDGHGGREVAVYCATHLAGMITASEAYKRGDIEAALKETFMHCDRQLLTEEAVTWLQKHATSDSDDDIVDDSGDEQEEASRLLEEADMPLENLLAQYSGQWDSSEVDSSGPGRLGAVPSGQPQEGADTSEEGGGSVRSMLQMLASRAGIEIAFPDEGEEENSEESEYEGESGEEEEDKRQMEEGEDPPAVGSTGPEGTTASEANEERDTMEPSSSSSEGTRAETSSESTESVGGDSRGTEREGTCNCEVASSQDVVIRKSEKEVGASGCDEETHCQESACENINSNCNSDLPANETDADPALTEQGGGTEEAKGGDDSRLKPSNLESSSKRENTIQEDVDSSSSDVPSRTESSRNGDGRDRFFTRDNSRPSDNPCLVNLLTSALEDRESSTPIGLDSPDAMTTDERVKDRNSKPAEMATVSPILLQSRKRRRIESPEELEEIRVLEESPKRPCRHEGYHSGTTAVLCLLRDKELYVANAGDSRCVLSIDGKALDMSQDHKPTDAPELQRIEKAGGKVGADSRVNGGLNLSRALGDHFYKENTSLPLEEQMITAMPEVQRRTLSGNEEFLVVACDGIWNSKSSQEVVDFVRTRLSEGGESDLTKSQQLVRICEALCDACLAPDTDNDGTGCDNMTCVLVALQPVDSQ